MRKIFPLRLLMLASPVTSADLTLASAMGGSKVHASRQRISSSFVFFDTSLDVQCQLLQFRPSCRGEAPVDGRRRARDEAAGV